MAGAKAMNYEYASTLLVMQIALERSLLDNIQEFERHSGLYVHGVKIFRSDMVRNGRRIAAGVEVAAQLR